MDGLAERERDRVAPYPSEAQLLDVLYEVLAQGLPAPADVQDGALSRADVERFLHEHARTPKPREELLRFLSVHGLPVEPSEVSADHELALLARGLQRAQRSASLPAPTLPGTPSPDDVTPLSEEARAAFEEVEDETTSPRIVVPRPSGQPMAPAARPASPRTMIALALAAVALAVALLLSQARTTGLREQLALARTARAMVEQREASLRTEVQRLRTELETRRQERARTEAERVARDEAQAAAAQRYAAETGALERALGPRYRVARQQLAKVGVLPPF